MNEEPETQNLAGTSINTLVTYIPTEVVMIYVAAMNAFASEPGQEGAGTAASVVSDGEWWAFWLCLGAAPVVVWLLYAAKVPAAKKPLPVRPNRWPRWEMFAALVAFVAWAIFLPESPFEAYGWRNVASAILILGLATTFLTVLSGIVLRMIQP